MYNKNIKHTVYFYALRIKFEVVFVDYYLINIFNDEVVYMFQG